MEDLALFLPKDAPFLVFSASDDPPLGTDAIEQLERALGFFRRERYGAVRSWVRVHQPGKLRHVFVVILGGEWVSEEQDVHVERINLGYYVARRVTAHHSDEKPIQLSKVYAYAAPEVRRKLRLRAKNVKRGGTI